MKMIKKISYVVLSVLLLSGSCFAQVSQENASVTVSAKNSALILGATVSLSVTDVSDGSVVMLDDKLIEKDGTVEFGPLNFETRKGLKVYETTVTSYGFSEKDTVILLQRDADGGISELMADTKTMPTQYLVEALGKVYAFLGMAEQLALVPKAEYAQLAAKLSAGAPASEAAYRQMLTDEIVLHTAKNRLAEQIMTQFEGTLGMTGRLTNYNSLSNYQKEALFRNIAGKNYNNVNELIAELNTKITSLLTPVTPGIVGGGVSSGGGGGGGGGVPVTITPPAVTTPNVSETEKPIVYTDMENAKWALEAVEALSELEIINGYEDFTFRPENSVTRAEFLKMLVQLTKVSQIGSNPFDDVAESDWFYSYVMKAYHAGFARGDGKNFHPDDKITRQDMGVMCMNVLQYYEVTASEKELNFTDKNKIAEYAASALATLSEMKIINGMPDGSFQPENTATRAESASIIYKLWNVLEGIK